MKKQLLVLLALGVVQISFGQTAISSTLHIGGSADADTSDSTNVTVGVSNSQGNTLNPLGASFGALNTSDDTQGSISIYGSLLSTWSSSAAGHVSTTNGWDIDTPHAYTVDLNEAFTGDKAWTYTFTATEDSFFCLTYDVVGTGDTFGLQTWNFGFDGVGGGEQLGPDPLYPDGSGTLMRSLVSGETYTVSLSNYGNIFGSSGLILEASSVGEFDWEIKPVPEPASMVILGLGALGLARRRRKS